MFFGDIMAFIMTAIGQKGVNFAQRLFDSHLLRNYLHYLDIWGEERANTILPKFGPEITRKYVEVNTSFRKLIGSIKQKR